MIIEKPLYKSSSPYQRMTGPRKFLLPVITLSLFLGALWALVVFAIRVEGIIDVHKEDNTDGLWLLVLLNVVCILLAGMLRDKYFSSDLKLTLEGIKVKYWPYRLPQSIIIYHTVPLGQLHMHPLELDLAPLPGEVPGFQCTAMIRKAGPGGKDLQIRGFEEDPVAFMEALKQTGLGEFALKNVSLKPLLKSLLSEEGVLEFLSSSPKEAKNRPLELVRYFKKELMVRLGDPSGEEDLALRGRKEQILTFLQSLKSQEI